MNPRFNMCDAHGRALNRIRGDAEFGRLPFYDYVIEYCAYFDQRAPQSSLELIDYLQSCPKIGDSEHERSAINSIYREHSLEIPIGLMDLPVWWAKAIIASIREINWVESDPERTQAVFGWNMVHLQGAYLDIQNANPITASDEDWYPIGTELVNLHRRFEPGPFSQPGRLIEFI